MKYKAIITSSLAGALLLTGCAGGSGEGDGDGATLVVFGPNQFNTIPPNATEEAYTRVQDELAAGFMEKFPEVTNIVFDAQGTFENEVSRTQNAQLAGEQMDVVVCAGNPTNTSYQPLGLLEPLDDLAAEMAGEFSDGAIEAFTIDDQVWGIPLSGVAVTTFFYNKTLFEEHGIAEPATYEDMLAASATLKEAGVEPVVHNGKDLWMWPIWYMSALSQTTGGEHAEKTISNLQGETSYTDAADVQALELTRQWMEDGIMGPGIMDMDGDSMTSAFLRGDAAAYFGASWDLPSLRERVTDFELGIFKFPAYEGMAAEAAAFGGIENGLCVAKNSENKELAKEFIRYVASGDNAAMVLNELTPVATSHVAYDGADDALANQIRDEYLPASKFLDWTWPRELNDAIQRAVQAMMGGSVTPEEAAQQIQDAYDQLVDQGYVYGS